MRATASTPSARRPGTWAVLLFLFAMAAALAGPRPPAPEFLPLDEASAPMASAALNTDRGEDCPDGATAPTGSTCLFHAGACPACVILSSLAMTIPLAGDTAGANAASAAGRPGDDDHFRPPQDFIRA